MPQIIFITASGAEQSHPAQIGESVMQVAISQGVDGIVGECGGSALCATCHVYVDEVFLDRLEPRSDIEEEMLGCAIAEQRPNSRLACQIKMSDALDGLRITLPEAQQ